MSTPDDKLIDYDRTAEITGLSVRTLQRMVRDGQFPGPVDTGRRVVRFALADVVGWVRGRAAGRVQTAALR